MLRELEALLVAVAMGEVPNRQSATGYTMMRLALLQSYDVNDVPGFLQQCISIYKFREFITLYDGRAEGRRRFITDVFDSLHASSRTEGTELRKSKFVSRVF